MDLYLVARGLHIFSAFILFGTGLGTAFHMSMACRSGAVAGIARVARQVVLADWLFTLPAGCVQLATGLWLVHLAGHDLAAPWLLLSYLLYATAGIAWLVVVKLQLDLQRLATTALDRNAALPDRFWQAFTLWVRLGWVGFVSLIGVFVLMVARPALW
ncbi:DUF2269 family protein [Pelagibius sp.]|uniref:DUF2269 family protein n=1 Tax=Pelagibius sp. TaxID=1931238 RepID=UPI003B506A20